MFVCSSCSLSKVCIVVLWCNVAALAPAFLSQLHLLFKSRHFGLIESLSALSRHLGSLSRAASAASLALWLLILLLVLLRAVLILRHPALQRPDKIRQHCLIASFVTESAAPHTFVEVALRSWYEGAAPRGVLAWCVLLRRLLLWLKMERVKGEA